MFFRYIAFVFSFFLVSLYTFYILYHTKNRKTVIPSFCSLFQIIFSASSIVSAGIRINAVVPSPNVLS